MMRCQYCKAVRESQSARLLYSTFVLMKFSFPEACGDAWWHHAGAVTHMDGTDVIHAVKDQIWEKWRTVKERMGEKRGQGESGGGERPERSGPVPAERAAIIRAGK